MIPSPWIILAVVLAFVASGAYWNHHGYNTATTEWEGRIAATRAAAEQTARITEHENQRLKEKTDAENWNLTVSLRNDITRLRNNNARRGNLSSPAPTAGSPDKTCFDAAKFDSALRELDQDFLGIVEAGSQAVIDLDSAKMWAMERK